MAPAQDGRIGEEQDGDRDEGGSGLSEGALESKADQGRGSDCFGRLGEHAGLQVDGSAAQDGQSGQGTDHDGVRKDLKDAPHSLFDRLDDVGAGVDHDRGTKAGFIGEDAALHAHLHGQGDAGTDNASRDRLQGKGALDNGDKDSGHHSNVHDDDHEGSEEIEDDHERHQLLRKGRDPLKAADDDQGDRKEQEDTDCQVGDAESMVHVFNHTVDLAHIADPEGSEQTEAGKKNSQKSTDGFAVFPAAETVAEIVHGSADPLSLSVLPAVKDTQDILRKIGHHAEKGDQPHPEDRAGSAGGNSACHTDDISGADRGGQGCAQGLELGDGSVFGMGCDTLLAEDLADGMADPVGEVGNLVEPGKTGHQNAREAQQDQGRPAPYETVYSVIDVGDRLQHKHFLPVKQKLWSIHVFLYAKIHLFILNDYLKDVK